MRVISRLNMSLHQNKKGFTITEVIVSGLIIAVLAAGVFSAFFEAQRLLNRARHRTQAYNFAVEALDRLRSNYKYSDTKMDAASGYSALDIGCAVTGEMATLIPLPLGENFTYNVTEPESHGYKQVTVTVQWNEPTF